MTSQPSSINNPSGQPSDGPSKRPAHVFAAQRDWPKYFEAVAGKPPRDTLVEALDAFEREPRTDAPTDPSRSHLAIDLGCGEGRDTAELLARGWRVLAIDGHPDAIRRLGERDLPRERFELVHGSFESIALPQAKLVNASFSLPFCPPEHFDALWNRIRNAIEPGGRFAGQLFGDRDDWASLPDRAHHTRSQAQGLLDGLDIEKFEEVEDEGKDVLDNPKHWHRFDIVARRPQ